jgi:hypothetical protein
MSNVGWPERTLLRERSHDEVYFIRGGSRSRIPNEYVLEALGGDWGPVQLVDEGALDHIPIEGWPTIGTPGSTVMVPVPNMYNPVDAATSKPFRAWGHDLFTIELRGWLIAVAQECNDLDPDWGYELLLDSGWALSRGIDLHRIVYVGNILQLGEAEAGFDPQGNRLAWCARPKMHIEVSGHPVKGQPERKCPADWRSFGIACHDRKTGVVVRWPFDPRHPRPQDDRPLQPGQYVRVVGSLVRRRQASLRLSADVAGNRPMG